MQFLFKENTCVGLTAVTLERQDSLVDYRVEVFPERLLVFRSPQGLSVRTCLEQRDSVIDQLLVQSGKQKVKK